MSVEKGAPKRPPDRSARRQLEIIAAPGRAVICFQTQPFAVVLSGFLDYSLVNDVEAFDESYRNL